MAPPRKISRRQLEILVDYLENHKDISGGTPFTPVGYHAAKLEWTIVAKKLNAVENGAQKSPEAWKKYWFEWRHKCRKKAANIQNQLNSSGGCQKVTLNDIEVRALNINGKKYGDSFVPSSEKIKKMEVFLSEDSDTEQQLKIDEEQNTEDVKIPRKKLQKKLPTEKLTRSSTPPPEWAIDLEHRRIAAEERIANALESIASMMQVQEDRRSLIEERIADTLTTIAGNLQELNCNVNQKNLQHLQQTNHDQTETSSMKDVIFL